jgi:hypothetical protein
MDRIRTKEKCRTGEMTTRIINVCSSLESVDMTYTDSLAKC